MVMKNMLTTRKIFLIVFFSLQIAGILVGRFTKTKFFCWAPYDEISFYDIDVTVDGVELGKDEITDRYRKPEYGRENRSIHNLISIIRQYETTYGKQDNAIIELSFITNGHSEKIWTWPEDKIIP